MLQDADIPDGPLGVMMERGLRIVERDEIRRMARLWFRVWSQTQADVWYNVWHDGKFWVCECAHNQDGHRVCQHVLAAFIIAASESQESLDGPEGANLNLPEVWCGNCGCVDYKWRETRTLKRMVGKHERYECNECGVRFTDRPGFVGLHYADWFVLQALRRVANKQSPSTAAQTLWEDHMIRVSGRTIQRWVDKFPKIIEAFARKLKAECGDAATVDEKFFSSKGKGRWFFYTRDMKNRFILSSETAADKLNFVADHLFANMLKRLGKRPRFLLSDRLKGFREAFDKLLYTEPELESIQFANLALKGKHVDNNQHERQNGSLDEFLHGRRAFNSDHPGLFRLYVVFHNFLRPHMALGGKTPAEAAGIVVPGHDALRTLIRAAAASRFTFA